MNETTVLLDAGHGGIIHGRYVTVGKRFYGFHSRPGCRKHIQLAEGAFNRAVVAGLQAKLHWHNIKTHWINPENEDISLQARARRVNEIARRKKAVLLSVHHNAFDRPAVRGAEFFTSLGDTPADPIAEAIGKRFAKEFPSRPLRRSTINPSEYSKDAGYYILKSTVCPAVLSEWEFMTNEAAREDIYQVDEQVNFFTNTIVDMFDTGLLA